MPTARLAIGDIEYDELGPRDGRPVVFVHGYLMGGSLFAPLAERLAAAGLRCISPTWPLGAHRSPMRPDADLSVPGVAAAVAELLDELDLHDVVLVGNDTGGLICQVVAGLHAQRLGVLVLTSCDAFDRFPPQVLKPFILLSRHRAAFRLAMQPMRTRLGRRVGFGAMSHHDIDDYVAAWVRPVLSDPRVADDLRRFTATLERRNATDAAAGLAGFDKPALVAWSADDKLFPVDDGRELAAVLPQGRFELVEGARTFSMLDRTEALAALVLDVAEARTPAPD
ncbi:MAG: alpha/beta fold hydrolase [Marmoricola sp.]